MDGPVRKLVNVSRTAVSASFVVFDAICVLAGARQMVVAVRKCVAIPNIMRSSEGSIAHGGEASPDASGRKTNARCFAPERRKRKA
jgi:hypothetical protein